MMLFEVKPHSVNGGEVVEVFIERVFIAAIYPGDSPGEIRIVSKHFQDREGVITIQDETFPPAIHVYVLPKAP